MSFKSTKTHALCFKLIKISLFQPSLMSVTLALHPTTTDHTGLLGVLTATDHPAHSWIGNH